MDWPDRQWIVGYLEVEQRRTGPWLNFLMHRRPRMPRRLDEEALEGLGDWQRHLLRKVMATIERAAAHVARLGAPDRQQIAAVESYRVAAASPQDQCRCCYLASGLGIRLVMREIDPCCRTIV